MEGYGSCNVQGIDYYLYKNYVNGKREGNGRNITEDDKYYIGQFKNGLPNGKGVEYYKNGNIKYEGDFINGDYEGDGQYTWEDGIYYIGQFKNSVPNGNGIMFYSNGTIKNQGNWINGEFVGN